MNFIRGELYMKESPLINIKPFDVLGNDLKGVTATFSLSRKQADFIFLQRKAGSISGNTYHEGKNEGTNPKTFILAVGEIELNYRDVKQTKKNTVTVMAPSLIEIMPNVTHSVIALTDIVIFECNSISDIQQDRIKEEV